jgi:hypothetical protein
VSLLTRQDQHTNTVCSGKQIIRIAVARGEHILHLHPNMLAKHGFSLRLVYFAQHMRRNVSVRILLLLLVIWSMLLHFHKAF